MNESFYDGCRANCVSGFAQEGMPIGNIILLAVEDAVSPIETYLAAAPATSSPATTA